jgi:PhzF family phenazine biosynthesis protein
MTKTILAYQVDAFTDKNSGGSPTGVVLDVNRLNENQMLLITKKLKASHTAFIHKGEQPESEINICFFT